VNLSFLKLYRYRHLSVPKIAYRTKFWAKFWTVTAIERAALVKGQSITGQYETVAIFWT
jgi:hypothetical protein